MEYGAGKTGPILLGCSLFLNAMNGSNLALMLSMCVSCLAGAYYALNILEKLYKWRKHRKTP